MVTFKDVVLPPPGGKEKKISLDLSTFVPPLAPKSAVIPPKTKPVPVKQPMPKPVVEKKIEPKPKVHPIKKKVLDESKKLFAEKSTEENNVSKIESSEQSDNHTVTRTKPKKKIAQKEVKKKVPKKANKRRVVKKTTKYKKPKRSNDELFNALMGATSSTSMYPSANQRASSGSYAAKMIQQLYGNEFNTFSPTQKKFIQNNLGTIHRITQHTLTQNGYPRVAVQTRQQGTNVVSFYLHPNGDITGLKLKKPMGYEALDQNTLEVIRIAYKDYPLPNKKTKIMFYVTYRLY